MQIKTFRAKTMREALHLVRHELGPEASVLHARELNNGVISRLLGRKQIEVAAGIRPLPQRPVEETAIAAKPELAELSAASLASAYHAQQDSMAEQGRGAEISSPFETPAPEKSAPPLSENARFAQADFERTSNHGIDLTQTDTEQLTTSTPPAASPEPFTPAVEFSDRHFEAFSRLLDADIDEATSLALLQQLRELPETGELSDQLVSLIADQLPVSGAMNLEPSRHNGKAHVVALVGPTGVGKTTTLAKLAANFHLREKVRVGLLTVDTYRVAAVEQLKTYAEIIGLPMEVVSTPREMRDAMSRLQHLDLVLLDTAGRSPRDAIKISELKAVLREAHPDEVHLVLSATSSGKNLLATAEQFEAVGITSLLATKLDEATSLGRLVTLARQSRLPLSYLTHGQNVPDDISVAESKSLAQLVLEAGR